MVVPAKTGTRPAAASVLGKWARLEPVELRKRNTDVRSGQARERPPTTVIDAAVRRFTIDIALMMAAGFSLMTALLSLLARLH